MNGESGDKEWHVESQRQPAHRGWVAGQLGWVECRGPVGGSTYYEHGGGKVWVVAGHVDGAGTYGWGWDMWMGLGCVDGAGTCGWGLGHMGGGRMCVIVVVRWCCHGG